MEYLLAMGISFLLFSSVVACRESANVICSFSSASSCLFYNATGGHSHISLADVQPLFCCQKLQEPEQIVIIIKRFPCSHHNYIGNPLTCNSRNGIDLIQHLRGQEIPLEAIQGWKHRTGIPSDTPPVKKCRRCFHAYSA